MHICISKLTIIGSGWHQAIILTSAGILLVGPIGTNFNEILIEIQTFSFKNAFENVVCELAAILFRPWCVNGVYVILTEYSTEMKKI